MENAFEKLDQEICKFYEEISITAASLEFTTLCEFTPGDKLDEDVLSRLSCPGVYLIEVKTENGFTSFKDWVVDFRSAWEMPEYIYQFVPNLKKKRIESHTELEEWVPIYLGKSKWLRSRIVEHLEMNLMRHTFALKLNARQNMKGKKFRIGMISIPVKNYDWIVPIVENVQREKINPIIGKK